MVLHCLFITCSNLAATVANNAATVLKALLPLPMQPCCPQKAGSHYSQLCCCKARTLCCDLGKCIFCCPHLLYSAHGPSSSVLVGGQPQRQAMLLQSLCVLLCSGWVQHLLPPPAVLSVQPQLQRANVVGGQPL
jgi:hypothetical protein